MKFTRYFLSIIFLTGCSSMGVDRDVQNTIIHEFYAEVSVRNEVELSSNVKTGIVGGSIIGALELSDGDSEDIIGGAIIGAIFGGLFTSLSEGGNQAFEYHLYSPDQGDFTLIQKEKVDITSGCLLVRVSNTTNVMADNSGRCKTN